MKISYPSKDRVYYVSNNKKYYSKKGGWVDHKNFADMLTYEEVDALKEYYPSLRVIGNIINNKVVN